MAHDVKTDRSAGPAGSGIVLFSTARIVCHTQYELSSIFKGIFSTQDFLPIYRRYVRAAIAVDTAVF